MTKNSKNAVLHIEASARELSRMRKETIDSNSGRESTQSTHNPMEDYMKTRLSSKIYPVATPVYEAESGPDSTGRSRQEQPFDRKRRGDEYTMKYSGTSVFSAMKSLIFATGGSSESVCEAEAAGYSASSGTTDAATSGEPIEATSKCVITDPIVGNVPAKAVSQDSGDGRRLGERLHSAYYKEFPSMIHESKRVSQDRRRAIGDTRARSGVDRRRSDAGSDGRGLRSLHITGRSSPPGPFVASAYADDGL